MMKTKLMKIKKEKEKVLSIIPHLPPQSSLEVKYLCFLGELEKEENCLYRFVKIEEEDTY